MNLQAPNLEAPSSIITRAIAVAQAADEMGFHSVRIPRQSWFLSTLDTAGELMQRRVYYPIYILRREVFPRLDAEQEV